MNVAVLIAIFLIGAALGGYTMAFQAATLYWGRLLAGEPGEDELIQEQVAAGRSEVEGKAFVWGYRVHFRGVQDAVTPRSQTCRNILFAGFIVAGLVVGWMTHTWYVGLLMFFGIFVMTGFIKQMMPAPDSEYFRERILSWMIRRRNRHIEEGDSLRVEACDYFIKKMEASD